MAHATTRPIKKYIHFPSIRCYGGKKLLFTEPWKRSPERFGITFCTNYYCFLSSRLGHVFTTRFEGRTWPVSLNFVLNRFAFCPNATIRRRTTFELLKRTSWIDEPVKSESVPNDGLTRVRVLRCFLLFFYENDCRVTGNVRRTTKKRRGLSEELRPAPETKRTLSRRNALAERDDRKTPLSENCSAKRFENFPLYSREQSRNLSR